MTLAYLVMSFKVQRTRWMKAKNVKGSQLLLKGQIVICEGDPKNTHTFNTQCIIMSDYEEGWEHNKHLNNFTDLGNFSWPS